MQVTPRERLMQFAHVLQSKLFGAVEEETGPLSQKGRLLLAVLSLVPLGRYLPPSRGWRGRPARVSNGLHCQGGIRTGYDTAAVGSVASRSAVALRVRLE
jgi:hypothetical protein